MSKLPLILVSAPLAFLLLLHGVIVPMHVGDLGWPDHARHHVPRAACPGAVLAGLGLRLHAAAHRERDGIARP